MKNNYETDLPSFTQRVGIYHTMSAECTKILGTVYEWEAAVLKVGHLSQAQTDLYTVSRLSVASKSPLR